MDQSYIYTNIDTISSSNEIINPTTKYSTLSVLKEKLKTLQDTTKSDTIKAMIGYNLTIIEDALKIDMYKFQLKGLKDMLEKDIKNFSEAVALEKL